MATKAGIVYLLGGLKSSFENKKLTHQLQVLPYGATQYDFSFAIFLNLIYVKDEARLP